MPLLAAPPHTGRHEQAESPRRKASLLSQLFFSWMLPLLQKGFRRPLTLDDMYRVLPEDECGFLGDQLEAVWKDEIKRKKHPSLARTLARVYGKTYCLYGIYAFYEECIIKVLQPVCLGLLLRVFASPTSFPPYMGYIYASSLVVLSLIYTSSDHPFTFAMQHLGMKVRIAVCSLIYRKALRMSRSSLEETTPGQIVNYLSSDMNRFDTLLSFLHYIVVAPLQLGIVIGVMYWYIGMGWPCLAGIILIIIFVPFQGLMGHIFSKLREETAKRTDKRLILMDEILQSIRTIKLYAWEMFFMKQVQTARKLEVSALKKTAFLKAVNQALFFVTSKVTLFITLITYVLAGNRLSSEIVFVSLALYNNVQVVMTLYFPAAIASLAETLVAVHRFQDFLLLDEFQKPNLHSDKNDESKVTENKTGESQLEPKLSKRKRRKSKTNSRISKLDEDGMSYRSFPDPNLGIEMTRATAQWNKESKDMAYNDVSLKVRSGEITALIGPVGSGKGSVIQTILYELPLISGTLNVKGSVAYTSQEPWIFPGSIRENILFGKDFDPEWYDKVIEGCALTRDLTLLPYGDHTVVGDRGTQLSGGQKARINLARAVYSDADIYLLDDPLAAVDAQVGRFIVTKCILGLLKNKARILVTHQLQYLSSMTDIILLVNGSVSFRGSYTELLSSGIPFTDILLHARFTSPGGSNQKIGSGSRIGSGGGSKTGIGGGSGTRVAIYSSSHRISSSTLVLENPTGTKMPTLNKENPPFEEVTSAPPPPPNPIAAQPSMTLTAKQSAMTTATSKSTKGDIVVEGVTGLNSKDEEDEEQIVLGGLSCKLYWTYLSAGTSIFALVIIVIIALMTQVLFTVCDFWLQYWISKEDKGNSSETFSWMKNIKTTREVQMGVYSGLVTSLFCVCLMRSVNFYRVCMQSSIDLHTRMFTSTLQSPVSFFEDNPIGRVLNRFSKDLGVIDESIPPVLFDTIEIFLQTGGVIFIVSSSSPIMLIPAVIIGIIFYFIRRFYFHTARAIKRLEGVSRSPVFSRLSTTMYGLPTIRAFKVEEMFKKEFEAAMDLHSSVWYLFLATSRWLGIVIDWISTIFVSCVMLNFLVTKHNDAVVGLAVTSAMMLTSMLQWGIRQSAELSNQMISVERVVDYCDLPPEHTNNLDSITKLPDDWPPNGEIKFRNLSLFVPSTSKSYILKNINCTIHGGEKVGVVGRTGAGKSSLLSVLFRLVEPSKGFIEIDGIMTSSLELPDLRSRISIIPQEPVLFQGTVRANLDPFEEFSDNEIWHVLKDVHLDDAVRDLPKGIYDAISEGGSNFSTGQKQLFCLARAILRSNQILVLDEATANVDPETDALIQRTLRSSFESCTVLTIAHRLHTVMDSDRILVLDAGQVVEFDEPERLLNDRTSALYALAQQTGKAEAANLLQIARVKGTLKKRRRNQLGDMNEVDEDDDDNDDDDEDIK